MNITSVLYEPNPGNTTVIKPKMQKKNFTVNFFQYVLP